MKNSQNIPEEAKKKPRQSAVEIVSKAKPAATSNSVWLRGDRLRKACLILLHMFSMGLKSGE